MAAGPLAQLPSALMVWRSAASARSTPVWVISNTRASVSLVRTRRLSTVPRLKSANPSRVMMKMKIRLTSRTLPRSSRSGRTPVAIIRASRRDRRPRRAAGERVTARLVPDRDVEPELARPSEERSRIARRSLHVERERHIGRHRTARAARIGRRAVPPGGRETGSAHRDRPSAEAPESAGDEVLRSRRADLRRGEPGHLAAPELGIRIGRPLVLVDAPELARARVGRAAGGADRALIDDGLAGGEVHAAARMAQALGRAGRIHLEHGGALDVAGELFLDLGALAVDEDGGAAFGHDLRRREIGRAQPQPDDGEDRGRHQQLGQREAARPAGEVGRGPLAHRSARTVLRVTARARGLTWLAGVLWTVTATRLGGAGVAAQSAGDE